MLPINTAKRGGWNYNFGFNLESVRSWNRFRAKGVKEL
jgi:hypothetical protein